MKRVLVNSKYYFYPVMFDKLNPPAGCDVPEGSQVRVVEKHGCPPANTMGMCYVNLANDDGSETFAGMVCVNSLTKEKVI